jgi:hypothetical protein
MSTFEWGSDTWGQPGHNVHVADNGSLGYRIPFLSEFPNIVEAREVQR